MPRPRPVGRPPSPESAEGPRALEKHPGHKPRIISDNGPQFIAKNFEQFVRLAGITHVRTSPYYPQSNGKLERWHGTLKGEEFRRPSPSSPPRPGSRPSPAAAGNRTRNG
jgi:transposase InsO family protein